MMVDQILDNLYVGPCPMDATEVEPLKQAGVTAVLNLQTDEDIEYRGVERKGLEAAYRRAGIKEVREPIRDFDYDHLRARLPEVVEKLHKLFQAGHKVYVHCTAGMNRSPTVVIAYLYWVLGWNLDRSVSHVMEKHYCYPLTDAITSQAAPTFTEQTVNPDQSTE